MAEPTLSAVFGSNATQTTTEIIISKSDLATKGLTPSAINTAESLLIAIALLAKDSLTPANQTLNTDQSIAVTQGLSSLTTTGGNTYKQIPINITTRKLDLTYNTLDPDDY